MWTFVINAVCIPYIKIIVKRKYSIEKFCLKINNHNSNYFVSRKPLELFSKTKTEPKMSLNDFGEMNSPMYK